MKITHKILVAGLLQIHKTRKESDTDWDMTDAKAASSAAQVATKTALLKRHVSQATENKKKHNGLV